MAMRAEKPSSPVEKEKTAVKRMELLPTAGKKPATKVIIRTNIGFGNFLSIRGSGAGLSWDKGIQLKNVKADEWVWETSAAFKDCEFKVLLNDQLFEAGENHRVKNGEQIQYTPKF